MSRFATVLDLPPHLRQQAESKLNVRQVIDGKNVAVLHTKPVKRTKYNAEPVRAEGYRFSSKHEYSEYLKARVRERAGEIEGLRVHVKFALFDPGGECRGEYVGTYTCDFVWRESGKIVVADAKSEATARRRDWPRTKKLMRMCHGHEVIEL